MSSLVSDIVLESIRSIILLIIIIYMWNVGKNRRELLGSGWVLFFSGFLLLLFGSIIDITDNFESLGRFIVIGDTEVEAFLEKMIGFLGGFLLIAIGLIKWIPDITAVGELEKEIAERKEAEVALVRAKILAEGANRTKSEFLTNMSHELRTPLNSVIGFSQLLEDESFGDLNEKQVRYVSNIQKSGRHLLNLINNILDISKIETGEMTLYPEHIRVSECFNEIVMLMEPMANKKYIDLISNVEPVDMGIYADRMMIKEILYNLLSNALKFTPVKGNVWINAKYVNEKLQISVSDTGIGIPRNELKTIFEPFKQVDSSISREYGGTGLGLALVKQYVEMHNGQIQVESEVGGGSTFTFTIMDHKI
ncbi:ATP-binding protein [Methanolobus sp. ZRKC3]|uniref:sensor histidine kinase n=1 Tax=Methanolobus sp. ZRKC3 TaxID=3125786 RepID=UPI00324C10A2